MVVFVFIVSMTDSLYLIKGFVLYSVIGCWETAEGFLFHWISCIIKYQGVQVYIVWYRQLKFKERNGEALNHVITIANCK